MPEVHALIERAKHGDKEAFAGLYDRYARPVFLDLVGRLGSREDAEDVLQAVFLKAWTRLRSLRRPERFAPWLFRMARNRAIDHLRYRRRRPMEALPDDVFAPDLTGLSADDEAVHRAVAALKPESRSLLMLRAVHGWPATEVAEAWGQSAATVRRHYARLLAHLESRLGKEHANV